MRRKSVRRRAVRIGLVSFNVALLVVVALFLVIQPSQRDNHSLALATPTGSDSTTTTAVPLDQLSSANIALTVARMGNLPETTAITNQADSEDVELDQASTNSSLVSTKPQIVASSFKSAADIQSYTVVAGDTIASIATKFGVTSDSIRWSNNLSGTRVSVGSVLTIPPLNGIVYTVASGDTADSIAAKFSADKNKIIAFNDAEISGLKVGQRIIIPDGTKAALVARTSISSSRFYGSASYGYNGYDYGYCTWWVARLRALAGNPVPTNLGNASTWAIRAAAFGLPTGTTPRVGAAVVTSTRGAGHVAYVTAVNDDGSIWVSQMNSSGQVSMTDTTLTRGWNRVSYKLWSGSQASGFRYIY